MRTVAGYGSSDLGVDGVRHMRKLLLATVVLGGAAWAFGWAPSTAALNEGTTSSELVALAPAAPQGPTCDVGIPASGDVVAVRKSFHPRKTPSMSGLSIRNEKASSALGRTHFHQIDHSTTVRHLCVEGDWSEVKIVTPSWLTFVQGWVPNDVLRGIERTASGQRVYVEDDFIWDRDTSRYKPEIVTIVNRIAQEHKGCSTIDTASVAQSPSRSKIGDPVYFVTCGTSFNVYFRIADAAEAAKSFTAPQAISQDDAVLACEQAAKSAAVHPSTVDFSRIMDVSFSTRDDGRASLDSSFSAKNGFNLTHQYRIRCLFDADRLIESSIVVSG